mmetsp:Transcript_22117/g.48192  ORF Transcript_22117/g.48192 Transcript_22117/m.48192 type:complete len:268 (+) Transcript_22117:133-936(+)
MSSSITARDASILSFGAALGAASMYLAIRISNSNCRSNRKRPAAPETRSLPPFARELERNAALHQIRLREWEDMEWRQKSGWRGKDFCHNPEGRAVRVLSYYYADDNCPDGKKDMTGVVWFGPDAESHRGLCHGGAMSALMDDFCGHVAFVTSDSPWSGATVQVNVSLKKPVKVGSVLRIVGRVSKREGRKVHVEAVLDDGGGWEGNAEPVVYAVLEGLSIDGVKMSEHDDEIATRTWEMHTCREGRRHRRDSGWNIKGLKQSDVNK